MFDIGWETIWPGAACAPWLRLIVGGTLEDGVLRVDYGGAGEETHYYITGGRTHENIGPGSSATALLPVALV